MFKRARVLLTVMLLGVLSTTLFTATARGQAYGTATVDTAFRQAFQRGDVDTVANLFLDNGALMTPFGVFKGPAEVRTFFVQFGGSNPNLSVAFGASTVVDNTAIHRIAIASDPIRAAGVSRIWLIHTLVVRSGKIVSLTAEMDLSDAETARFAAAGGQGG